MDELEGGRLMSRIYGGRAGVCAMLEDRIEGRVGAVCRFCRVGVEQVFVVLALLLVNSQAWTKSTSHGTATTPQDPECPANILGPMRRILF